MYWGIRLEMTPIPINDGCDLPLQALLRTTCESSCSAYRKIVITGNHLGRKCVLAGKDFVEVIQFGQNPTVVCDHPVSVSSFGCGGHLLPWSVEGVIGESGLTEPEAREQIAILPAGLADHLAPKVKVSSLVFIETRALPPLVVI